MRLAGVVLVVIALLATYSWVTRASSTTTVPVDDEITRVVLDVTAGDIELGGGGGDRVEYVSHTDDGWIRSAQVTYEVDGDTLRIEGNCRGNRFLPAFGCHTDVTVTVPDGVEVVAMASGGSIVARGLTGTTRLDSSAGRVTVSDHVGELRARSTAEDVVVTGLTSDEARVTSSAGSVRVEALTPMRSLDAESSGGPVTVVLPGAHAYHVEARTQAGGTTVDVDTNYSSVYRVRAFSSAGPVTVTAR